MKKLLILFCFLLFLIPAKGQLIINAGTTYHASGVAKALYTDDFETYASYTVGSETKLDGLGNWILGKTKVIIFDDGGDNHVAADANTAISAVAYNNTFANNQYAQITIDGLDATSTVGPCVRLTGSAATLCSYLLEAKTGRVNLVRIDNGTPTELANATTFHAHVGDVIKIQITGTAITCYINGALVTGETFGVGTITDVTYASGKAGIAGYNWSNGSIGDNWEGGDL